MKRIIGSLILLSASSAALAVQPTGADCGWGNLLFEGQSGMGPHLLASTTNGSTGNNTFGMTTGTNGCSADGTLTYGGQSMLGSIMGEFTEDVARGEGEALNAVAVMYGIAPEDRQVFAQVTHKNFEVIFPSEKVTAKEVMESLNAVMEADARLSKYVV